MSRRLAVLFVAGSVVIVKPAAAHVVPSQDDRTQSHGTVDDNWQAGYDPGKQLRRSDFTAGIGFGLGFGSAVGYPNEVAKIDDPKYKADTGFAGSNATSIWLGVAFRDWLVFGVGFRPYTIQTSQCPIFVSDTKAPVGCVAAKGAAFMTHIEAYPFFYMAPALQDLGIFTELGLGSRYIVRGTEAVRGSETIEGAERAADGGSLAFMSLGVVYEFIRLGDHISMGPYIQGSHEFSETLRADQFVLGFRAVYYGGP